MNYIKKEWLNTETSPSTGSIVVFDGKIKWGPDKDPEREMWVEISDCHCKVRLHKSYEDTASDFCDKLCKIESIINDFIKHINSTL